MQQLHLVKCSHALVSIRKAYQPLAVRLLASATLMALAMTIGMYRLYQSGTLWPDGPRYANAGAMIYDWIRSGDYLHPVRFAEANYIQYPAFSIPYHPPAYPGLLALWFVAVGGVSYGAARFFVAGCLGIAAITFQAILSRLGVRPCAAFLVSLLFVTTPEVAKWSRDTMSEVPAMSIMFIASYVFLGWLEYGGALRCWASFALATLGYFCRVTSCGILPGWLLYALVTGRARRFRSPHPILAGAVYLLLAAGFLAIAVKNSRYEVVSDGKAEGFVVKHLYYFSECLPPMLAWGSTIAAGFGILSYAASGRRMRAGTFWFCWAVGYTAFKAIMPTTNETRHFFGVLPALAGLASCLLSDQEARRARDRIAANAIVCLGIMVNLWNISGVASGLVGYEEVSRTLASLNTQGNIFMACHYDQDLIFRYRSEAPESHRILVRSDRTLAIRLPVYAAVAPVMLVENSEDVLNTLVKVRSRYLVTAIPETSAPEYSEENRLTHRTMVDMPDDFRLLGMYPLLVQFERPGKRWKVYVWEYQGRFPDGPVDFSVIIPTANKILHAH